MSFSASVCGSSGNSGKAKPLSCNSLMASFNCGIEALTLGNFIILVDDSWVKAPNLANASGTCWSSGRRSPSADKIRAANEISLNSTSIPALEVKLRIMGSSE